MSHVQTKQNPIICILYIYISKKCLHCDNEMIQSHVIELSIRNKQSIYKSAQQQNNALHTFSFCREVKACIHARIIFGNIWDIYSNFLFLLLLLLFSLFPLIHSHKFISMNNALLCSPAIAVTYTDNRAHSIIIVWYKSHIGRNIQYTHNAHACESCVSCVYRNGSKRSHWIDNSSSGVCVCVCVCVFLGDHVFISCNAFGLSFDSHKTNGIAHQTYTADGWHHLNWIILILYTHTQYKHSNLKRTRHEHWSERERERRRRRPQFKQYNKSRYLIFQIAFINFSVRIITKYSHRNTNSAVIYIY